MTSIKTEGGGTPKASWVCNMTYNDVLNLEKGGRDNEIHRIAKVI